MGNELSMTSRAEVTTRYAKVYAKASKKDKGRILDDVVGVTRWSRDNARRRLAAAAKRPPGGGRRVAKKPRKQRASKYSYDTVKVLQRVWAASGGQCGKYLVASMRIQLDGLERHGELVEGDTVAHCGPTLKGEFARTLNLTDVHTGWVFTRSVRNNAHIHILGALKAGVDEVPFEVTGLDFDIHTDWCRRPGVVADSDRSTSR